MRRGIAKGREMERDRHVRGAGDSESSRARHRHGNSSVEESKFRPQRKWGPLRMHLETAGVREERCGRLMTCPCLIPLGGVEPLPREDRQTDRDCFRTSVRDIKSH